MQRRARLLLFFFYFFHVVHDRTSSEQMAEYDSRTKLASEYFATNADFANHSSIEPLDLPWSWPQERHFNRQSFTTIRRSSDASIPLRLFSSLRPLGHPRSDIPRILFLFFFIHSLFPFFWHIKGAAIKTSSADILTLPSHQTQIRYTLYMKKHPFHGRNASRNNLPRDRKKRTRARRLICNR